MTAEHRKYNTVTHVTHRADDVIVSSITIKDPFCLMTFSQLMIQTTDDYYGLEVLSLTQVSCTCVSEHSAETGADVDAGTAAAVPSVSRRRSQRSVLPPTPRTRRRRRASQEAVSPLCPTFHEKQA